MVQLRSAAMATRPKLGSVTIVLDDVSMVSHNQSGMRALNYA
jgi:hypothetical protein